MPLSYVLKTVFYFHSPIYSGGEESTNKQMFSKRPADENAVEKNKTGQQDKGQKGRRQADMIASVFKVVLRQRTFFSVPKMKFAKARRRRRKKDSGSRRM